MSKRAASSPDVVPGTENNPLKWQQARERDAVWVKKDLLEVIYWIRQWLGLILGVVFGLAPVTGLAGHMLFFGLSVSLLFVYYTKYLGVDDEDEEFGRWDLLSEGLWTSYTLFVVTWICFYSLQF